MLKNLYPTKLNRILLVEDDDNLVFGIEYTLTSEGYAVVLAGSLEEARKALKTDNIDLILLDINLP
ncbi:response regulator, partial [Paenibacillus polymyxa]|uniref:response regulator n=1 Tax=Paenibacillus polymyxa TaxID=1406 RepID=UPI00107290EB